MPRDIIIHPNPLLVKMIDPVTDFSPDHLNPLISDIIETIREHKAYGLAANQIGIDQRILGVMMADNSISIFINPEITSTSYKQTMGNEACLSLPGMTASISRPVNTAFSYYCMKDGKVKKTQLAGLRSRIFNHEMDHLNGVLISHYIK